MKIETDLNPVKMVSDVLIIENNRQTLTELTELITTNGKRVKAFRDVPEFIEWIDYDQIPERCCVLSEVDLPEMSGIDLLNVLAADDVVLPTILMTREPTVSMAVTGLLSGAINFIEKPCVHNILLQAIDEALQMNNKRQPLPEVVQIKQRYAALSPRQKQVFMYVFRGKLNKTIADHLSISIKTVELHRAQMMEKMRAGSIAELVRMATLINDIPMEVH